MLASLFKVRQGVFQARIKFPDNIYTWPAFWMQVGSCISKNYQEIDWCEMYDDDPQHNTNICPQVRHQMRMNIYTGCDLLNGDKCERFRKFCLPDNFYTQYHDYQGTWTSFSAQFFLDNQYKGFATKYFDLKLPLGECKTGKINNLIPQKNYTCKQFDNLQDCEVKVNNYCVSYNKIWKDKYFPNTNNPMYIFITNGVIFPDLLSSNWNTIPDIDKITKVDYLIVYQPVQCDIDKQVFNELHFKALSGYTNFLSGRKITIGGSYSPYINEAPKASNGWHDFPTHILATEEIEFNPVVNAGYEYFPGGDIIFEEGTFLRAEIIDCSVTIDLSNELSQKILPTGNVLPPVLPIDYFDQQDTLTKQLFPDKPTISETDNGAIQIHPNPTNSHIHIAMPEEDWNDLTHIYLITPLGVKTELPKAEVQDLSPLPNGMYFLQFHFSNGMMVVKNVIKQE